ncbi:MAG: hypothetical protein AB1714_15445 [Acidobacteriota bacterium]
MIRKALVMMLVALGPLAMPRVWAADDAAGDQERAKVEEEQKRAEQERARAEAEAKKAAEEQKKHEAELKAAQAKEQQRRTEELRRVQEQLQAEMQWVQKAAEQEIRRAQEEMKHAQEIGRVHLIEPWGNPWEQDKEFDKIRVLFDMAEAQHEIVMMMIEDNRIDDVVKETQKIMQLGFPDRYDLFLLNEIDEVVDRLVQKSQDDAAIRVLEIGKNALRHPEAKVGLLMQVAKIHRKHKRNDLAIQAYREAISLNQRLLTEKAQESPKK